MAEVTDMVHIEGLTTFAPEDGSAPRIERLSAVPGVTVVFVLR